MANGPSLASVTRAVLLLALVGALAAWFFLFRPTPLGGPASYVMVHGPSMEPLLRTGDLAVMQRASYRVGDVVAFRLPEGELGEGTVIIHRIIAGNAEEGFVVQGDNKEVPDLWRPKPGDILGKMWFHAPGGGRWLERLLQPLPLAAVGGLAAFSFLGGDSLLGRGETKRRRKGGRRMPPGTGDDRGGRFPASLGLLTAAGVLALLGLGLVAAAVYSFLQPAAESRFEERQRYEHTASFEYTVRGQPSSLYPSGLIGPIAPMPGGIATEVTPPPIYTKLARQMDVGFTYALEGSAPADVAGDLSAVLLIQAGEGGWTKTQELSPPTPFVGNTVSTRVAIDLAEVSSLIESVEEETGFSPGTYDVSVIPSVNISGSIGEETVEDAYAPVFTIEFNQTQITPDSALTRSEVRTISDTVSQGKDFHLLGLSIGVAWARWLSATGAALVLAAASGLAAVALLRLSRDEPARIRTRYGSLLVSVAEADGQKGARKIRVASIQDLVRVAQRDGRMIFHQEVSAGSHRYFVDDGTVIYEYTAMQPVPQGGSSAEEGA